MKSTFPHCLLTVASFWLSEYNTLTTGKIQGVIVFGGDICTLGIMNKDIFAMKTRVTFVDERQHNGTSQEQRFPGYGYVEATM